MNRFVMFITGAFLFVYLSHSLYLSFKDPDLFIRRRFALKKRFQNAPKIFRLQVSMLGLDYASIKSMIWWERIGLLIMVVISAGIILASIIT